MSGVVRAHRHFHRHSGFVQMKPEPLGPLLLPPDIQETGPLFPEDYRIRGTGRPDPECNQPHGGRAGLSSAPMVSDWQRIWGQAHV